MAYARLGKSVNALHKGYMLVFIVRSPSYDTGLCIMQARRKTILHKCLYHTEEDFVRPLRSKGLQVKFHFGSIVDDLRVNWLLKLFCKFSRLP